MFRAPLDGRFHALPLRSEEHPIAHGLLLVSSRGPELHHDVVWLANLLAKQVSRLLSRQTLAETRQERMLLYSIINAVTDPILLTDTEGKLIIANSHAEKLFAAPEDASEGWRRAVALNNMLFSAALSTSAVADIELARRELLLVDPLEGSDLLFELLSSRAKDERQGTYVVSILRNVTDLARAKEEIEESYRTLRMAQAEVRDERHRLDLIIDSVADPILVTDQEGDIVLMNEPAERLFNLPGSASEAAQRHVRANGAHLTSFVSNVLTRTGEQRYRGEIQLSDPATGRTLPVEGVAGTILSEQGELMWVVTILHDLTEAIEKGRLFEQLKEASAELERKVQEATAELADQNELLRRQHIALEQASALEVAVPRQHVARVPDAAERDPRLHAHAPARRDGNGVGPAAEEPDAHRLELPAPARPHQRHPRHHQDRGGPDAAQPLQLRYPAAGGRGHVRAGADHQAVESDGFGPDAAGPPGPQERSAEGEADRSEPAEQRPEVHACRVGDD